MTGAHIKSYLFNTVFYSDKVLVHLFSYKTVNLNAFEKFELKIFGENMSS